MDENGVAGSNKGVKGAAKDAIGWVVSDAKLLERRGARRRSHEVRGPPRSELNRVGRRAMSAIPP
jgi:hypothetical protein